MIAAEEVFFISVNGPLDGWGCSGAGAGPDCTFPWVHYFYVHKQEVQHVLGTETRGRGGPKPFPTPLLDPPLSDMPLGVL